MAISIRLRILKTTPCFSGTDAPRSHYSIAEAEVENRSASAITVCEFFHDRYSEPLPRYPRPPHVYEPSAAGYRSLPARYSDQAAAQNASPAPPPSPAQVCLAPQPLQPLTNAFSLLAPYLVDSADQPDHIWL